ncbi:MAG: cupin domain-containing protein [Magnetococcales bacterium]|nr:cupin domain-containing protein [Magnetococcales bacterium]
MLLTEPKIAHEDSRGAIKDILYNEALDAVTIIESKKGVVRGNHYHKDTVQWVFLQSGRLKSLTQIPGEPVEVNILEPGQLIKTDHHESHALEALEDSIFLVLTRGPRGGMDYEKDTFRLESPLIDPN